MILMVAAMVMATDPDPHLYSTSVVEDVHDHDDVIALKLSYVYNECFFTVLISDDLPQHLDPDHFSSPGGLFLRDLIARFNEACTWTDRDKTIDDVDKKLDSVWQEAEDLVRTVAFPKMLCMGREHGREAAARDMSDWSPTLLTDYLFPKSFNIQLVPENGWLNAISRPDLPRGLPFAVEFGIPSRCGLLSLKPEDILILRWYRPHVLKVQTQHGIFCCKLNTAGAQNSFLREFETLKRIRSSLLSDRVRVPKLRGVVEVQDGVVGILMDWIETEELDLMVLLTQRHDITDSTRQKWANQISETLNQLHRLDLTWGDAKTVNVLIDGQQNAWLIDFGGGFTRGWVDESLYDTQAGDLQGLENTLLDVFGKR